MVRQRIEHSIESSERDRRLKQRNFQKLLNTAMPVERKPRAGNGNERRSGNVFDLLPCSVAALERCLSDATVRIIHKRAALGHRQTLIATIWKKHVEFEFLRNRVIERP